MIKSRPEQRISRTAGTDITRHQALKFGANGVEPAVAAADLAFGIAEEDCSAGRMADVIVSGIGRAIASESIVAGTFLTAAEGGQVAATSAAGQGILGVALESATAGAELDILVVPSQS